MSRQFEFQDPGEGIHEAEVQEILVSAGDEVKEGQDVLVVETDKAAFELSSPFSGKVKSVHVSEGDTISVGDTLMSFGDDATGDDDGAQDEGSDEEHAEEPGEAKADGDDDNRDTLDNGQEIGERDTDPDPERQASANRRVPATPATRRVARELGVALDDVKPSGENGRVLEEDVRAHAKRKQPSGEEEEEESASNENRQKLRSVRRTTAKRMAQVWREVPHVTHHDEADITDLEAFRQRVAAKTDQREQRPTLTALAIKAVCATLREFPRFNASFDADREEVIFKKDIHVGVAVDTERGLVVPIVKNAYGKSLRDLAQELHQLADRARQSELRRDALTGGTFTITNVGAIGGTGFTPIINPPQVAILGMAAAALRPRVIGDREDYEVSPRLILPLALAFDHRVIDGAEAARFAQRVAARLSDVDEFITSC